MLSWGILSGAMAFIPAIARATGLGNEHSFYLVRVLLGAAEAGFFPGIIFYLTLWFPAEYRARIVGYFMAAIPLSSVIGAPVSGALLYLQGGLGLAGWQWLFIVEAVPAIILAAVVFFYLTDRPADATWLATDERHWLAERLMLEERQRQTVHNYSVVELLFNPRVLGLEPGLLRRGGDELWLELLLAADHQGLWSHHLSHHSGRGHTLCRRSDRHGMVGPTLRPQGRTPVPYRLSAADCSGRYRGFHRT